MICIIDLWEKKPWKLEFLLRHIWGTSVQGKELLMFLEALANGEVTFLLLSTDRFLRSAPSTSLFLTTGIPTVAPPTSRPTPRPDVTPPPVGTFLLYAQGQQIGHLPLNGTRLQKDMAKTLLSLHVKWASPLGAGLYCIIRSRQGLRCRGAPGGLLFGSYLWEPKGGVLLLGATSD